MNEDSILTGAADAVQGMFGEQDAWRAPLAPPTGQASFVEAAEKETRDAARRERALVAFDTLVTGGDLSLKPNARAEAVGVFGEEFVQGWQEADEETRAQLAGMRFNEMIMRKEGEDDIDALMRYRDSTGDKTVESDAAMWKHYAGKRKAEIDAAMAARKADSARFNKMLTGAIRSDKPLTDDDVAELVKGGFRVEDLEAARKAYARLNDSLPGVNRRAYDAIGDNSVARGLVLAAIEDEEAQRRAEHPIRSAAADAVSGVFRTLANFEENDIGGYEIKKMMVFEDGTRLPYFPNATESRLMRANGAVLDYAAEQGFTQEPTLQTATREDKETWDALNRKRMAFIGAANESRSRGAQRAQQNAGMLEEGGSAVAEFLGMAASFAGHARILSGLDMFYSQYAAKEYQGEAHDEPMDDETYAELVGTVGREEADRMRADWQRQSSAGAVGASALAYAVAEYASMKIGLGGGRALMGRVAPKLTGRMVARMAPLNAKWYGALGTGAARTTFDMGVAMPIANGAMKWAYDQLPFTDSKLSAGAEELAGVWQELGTTRHWFRAGVMGMTGGVMHAYPTRKQALQILGERKGALMMGLTGEQYDSTLTLKPKERTERLVSLYAENMKNAPEETIRRAIEASRAELDRQKAAEMREDAAVAAALQIGGYSIEAGENGKARLYYNGHADEKGSFVRGEKFMELDEDDLNTFIQVRLGDSLERSARVMRGEVGKARVIDAIKRLWGGEVEIEWVRPETLRDIEKRGAKAAKRYEQRVREELGKTPDADEKEVRKAVAKEVHNDIGEEPVGYYVRHAKEATQRAKQYELETGKKVNRNATFSRAYVRTITDGARKRRILRVANNATVRELAEEFGEQVMQDWMEAEQMDMVTAFHLLDALRRTMAESKDEETRNMASAFLQLHKRMPELYKRVMEEGGTDSMAEQREVRRDVIEALSTLLLSDFAARAERGEIDLPSWSRSLFDASSVCKLEFEQDMALGAALEKANKEGWMPAAVRKMLNMTEQEVADALRNGPSVEEYYDAYMERARRQAEFDAHDGRLNDPDATEDFYVRATEAQKRADEARAAAEREEQRKSDEQLEEMEDDPENKGETHEGLVKKRAEAYGNTKQEEIEGNPTATADDTFCGGKCLEVTDETGLVCRGGLLETEKLTILPNFKQGADSESGVVEPLTGDYRPDHDPIRVWQREDGSQQVISGRHRLDAAKRAGASRIMAYVYREDAQHDEAWARRYDIESNIRDNQATPLEVALYVRGEYTGGTPLTDEEVARAGIDRKGKMGSVGYQIGREAGDSVMDALRNGLIDDREALAIAHFCPNDETVQRVGLKMALDGASKAEIQERMAAEVCKQEMQQSLGLGGTDLFGNAIDDDAFMTFCSKYVVRRRNELAKDAQYLRMNAGRKNSAEMAKKYGVNVNDPDALRAKLNELDTLRERWKHPYTDPELLDEIREAFRAENPDAGMSANERVFKEYAENADALADRQMMSEDYSVNKPIVRVSSDEVPEDKTALVKCLKALTGRRFYNKSAKLQASISGESAKKIARAEMETIENLTRLGYTESDASYIHRAAAAKIGELYEQSDLFMEEEVYHKGDDRKAVWHFFEPVTVNLDGKDASFLTNISVIDFIHGGERLFSLELTIENPIEDAEGRTAPASGRPAQHPNGVSGVRLAAFESFVKKEKTQIELDARKKGLIPWRVDESRIHEMQGEANKVQKEIDALLDKFGGDEKKLESYRRDRRKLYELREVLAQKQAAIAAEYKPENLADVTQPIAPNGKPSNLSVDSWITVRTKAFKKWFGDWENDPENASKLLDENGEPRVFYHGSWWDTLAEKPGERVFDINFLGSASGDNGYFGNGFYFAFDAREAEYYGGIVNDYFLNMRNPLYVQEELETIDGYRPPYASDFAMVLNLSRRFPDLVKDKRLYYYDSENVRQEVSYADFLKDAADVLENVEFITEETEDSFGKEYVVKASPVEMRDGDETWTEYRFEMHMLDDGMLKDKYAMAVEYLRQTKYNGMVLPSISSFGVTKEFTDAVKAAGYDGVLQSARGDEAVAFHPNQIKSATHNRGTFSEESESIDFSVASVKAAGIEDARKRGMTYVDPADGKEKFVIPLRDKDGTLLARLNTNFTNGQLYSVPLGGHRDVSLEALLHYDELYKNYPELRKMRVRLYNPTEDEPLLGYSMPAWNGEAAYIGINVRNQKAYFPDMDARNADVLNTLLHETQHAIQHYEGMARGANTAFSKQQCLDYIDSARQELAARGVKDDWSRDNMRYLDFLYDEITNATDGSDEFKNLVNELYWQSHGEQEARWTGEGNGYGGDAPMLGIADGKPSWRTIGTQSAETADILGGVTFSGMGRFGRLMEDRLFPGGEFTFDQRVYQMYENIVRRLRELDSQSVDTIGDGMKLAAEGLAVFDNVAAMLPDTYRFALEPYKVYFNSYAKLRGTGSTYLAGAVVPMKGWDTRMEGAYEGIVREMLAHEPIGRDAEFWDDALRDFVHLRKTMPDMRIAYAAARDAAEQNHQRPVKESPQERRRRMLAIDGETMQEMMQQYPALMKELYKAVGEMRADKMMAKFLERVRLQLDAYRKDRTLGRIRRAVDVLTPKGGEHGKPVKGHIGADDYRRVLDYVRLMELTKGQRDDFMDKYAPDDAPDGAEEYNGMRRWSDVAPEETLDVVTYDERGDELHISCTKQEYEVYACFDAMSSAQAEAAARALGEFIKTGRQAWENAEEAARQRIAARCAPLLEGFAETENQRRARRKREERSWVSPVKKMLNFWSPTMNDAQFFDSLTGVKEIEPFAREFTDRIAKAHVYMESKEKERHGFMMDAVCRAAGTTDRKAVRDWFDRANRSENTGLTLQPGEPDFLGKETERVRLQLLGLLRRKTHEKNFRPNNFAEALRYLAEDTDTVPPDMLQEVMHKYGSIGDASKAKLKGIAALNSLLTEGEMERFKNVSANIKKRAEAAREKWAEETKEKHGGTLPTGDGEPLELTRLEAAYRVLMCEQDDYRDMLALQGYDAATVSALRRFAGDDVMRLAYDLRDKLGERTADIREIYERVYGMPFPEVENYFRAYFDVHHAEKRETTLDGQGTGKAAGSGRVRILYTRQHHNQKLDPTMDVVTAFNAAMKEQDVLIGYGDLPSDITRLVNYQQEGVRMVDALHATIGAEATDTMLLHANNMKQLTGSAEETARGMLRALRALSSPSAVLILNYRVASLVKQYTALFNTVAGSDLVGMRDWSKSLARVDCGLGKISVKDIAERPELESRFKGWSAGVEKEMLFGYGDNVSTESATDAAFRAGMSLMEWVDVRANAKSAAVLYDAVYRKLEKQNKGASHDMLDALAMNEVRRALAMKSQPIDWRQRALLGTKASIFKVGNLFLGGESMNLLGNLARLMTRGKKGDMARFAEVWFSHGAALSLLTMAYNFLTDDEEQWKKRNLLANFMWGMALGPVNGIPFLSQVLGGAVNTAGMFLPKEWRGFMQTSSMVPLGDLNRAVSDVRKAFGKKGTWQDKTIAVNNLLRTMLVFSAAAFTNPTTKTGAVVKGASYAAGAAGNIADFLLRLERAAEERL